MKYITVSLGTWQSSAEQHSALDEYRDVPNRDSNAPRAAPKRPCDVFLERAVCTQMIEGVQQGPPVASLHVDPPMTITDHCCVLSISYTCSDVQLSIPGQRRSLVLTSRCLRPVNRCVSGALSGLMNSLLCYRPRLSLRNDG